MQKQLATLIVNDERLVRRDLIELLSDHPTFLTPIILNSSEIILQLSQKS